MKKITKTGENFIRTICSGTTNSLISGNYRYNLPFSTISDQPFVFTSNAIDHLGNLIVNNEQLGEALIFWYNKYAELNNLDANVLAAQGFAESNYRLWHYSRRDSGSGIADFVSIRVFRHIVNSDRPETIEALSSSRFTDDEINKIINEVSDPFSRTSYIYRGQGTTSSVSQIAINNRLQLFQNIIDNPEIMIKAQSNLMREIVERNNNLTANSLFAYDRYYLLSATSYPNLLDQAGRRFGDNYVQMGVDYVDKIFRYLGDENNDKINKRIDKPKGIWFGFNIDFTTNNFNAFLG